MKSVEEIYNEMMADYAGATGAEAAASSDLAVRMYAMAAQVFSLYVQCEWVERQCFPQTAEGTSLDMHAQLRGLERRAATAAEGVLRFTVDAAAGQDREIPAGTVCMTAGLVRFETVEPGLLRAGTTQADVRARALEPGSAGNVAAGTVLTMAVAPVGVSRCTNPAALLRAGTTQADVRARALEPGSAGNVAAGTVLTMAVAPVGVSRCTNPAAFSGGTDREDDETLRARVLETYRRMPNGANAAFYQQGALSFEEVAAATVIPRPRGVGTVDVVVATGAGAPGSELLKTLTDYFEERREIAVDLQVRAPTMKELAVSVQVASAANKDAGQVRGAVESALRAWFDGQRLGEDVLRARLGDIIYAVEGVENYRLLEPAADVVVAADELPRLSALTVEAMA